MGNQGCDSDHAVFTQDAVFWTFDPSVTDRGTIVLRACGAGNGPRCGSGGCMMADLEALLAGIVFEPLEETRWLVLADWLEENDDPRRAELLRLHRKLLATCCEPEAHPERKMWQARIVELIAAGVRPCVPHRVVQLPGGVPMTFSFIPPGSFLMGGNVNENEKPIHKVTLTKGFFLGIYPVTQAQWKAVMGTDPSYSKSPNRPVEQVSWDACQEFCHKLTAELNGRGRIELPTEAEWEWACRAGTTTEYHFGDTINIALAHYDERGSWFKLTRKRRKKSADVGSFPVNPWGIHDMHGNVWEWCADWFGDYTPSDQADPLGQSDGRNRILRGGSFNLSALYCRAAYRGKTSTTHWNFIYGFRVCFRLG